MYTLPRIDFCVGCKGFLPVSKKGESREFYCSECEPTVKVIVKPIVNPTTKPRPTTEPKTKKHTRVRNKKAKLPKPPKVKKLFTPVQEKILEIMTPGEILTLAEIKNKVSGYSPAYVHNNLKKLVKSGHIKKKKVGVSRPFCVYCISEINLEEYHRNSCEKMLVKIFKDKKVFNFDEIYELLKHEFSEKVIRNNICSLQRKGEIFTKRVNDDDKNFSIYSSSKENIDLDERCTIKQKTINFLTEKEIATNKEIREAIGTEECTIRSQTKLSDEFSIWLIPGKRRICMYSLKEKDEVIANSHPHLTKIK